MATILSLCALALLMLAGGIVLWHQANRRAQRKAATLFIDRQLQQRDASGAATLAAQQTAALQWRGAPRSLHHILLRAGLQPTTQFYAGLTARTLLIPLVLLIMIGPIAAGAALLALCALAAFMIWLKAERRHKKCVEQLPDFLEAMVRLLAIGNSLGAAFQTAAAKTEQPLQTILAHAHQTSRAGLELDVALRQAARQYGLYELYLVAAIIGVATRFGGRSDHVLDRMAAFMRDLTHARKELIAMSSETRMSAWVLALLPLGIGAFIITFNNALFVNMWQDPAGWKLLVGAAFLQVAGSYWLYRLSKLA